METKIQIEMMHGATPSAFTSVTVKKPKRRLAVVD
jgi:hypothetical protein